MTISKPTLKEELRVMVAFKKADHQCVVQFKDFGDPVAFKSADDVSPFMSENKLTIEWTKIIDDYITELCLSIA